MWERLFAISIILFGFFLGFLLIQWHVHLPNKPKVLPRFPSGPNAFTTNYSWVYKVDEKIVASGWYVVGIEPPKYYVYGAVPYNNRTLQVVLVARDGIIRGYVNGTCVHKHFDEIWWDNLVFQGAMSVFREANNSRCEVRRDSVTTMIFCRGNLNWREYYYIGNFSSTVHFTYFINETKFELIRDLKYKIGFNFLEYEELLKRVGCP